MDVEKIAELARIKLSDEEKKSFSEEFRKIVEWVSELKKIDTSGIAAFHFPSDFKLREDSAIEFKNSGEIISNFPDKEFNFLKVKKVID